MKIVMTGGTGFVGKHLTQALRKLGNQVIYIGRSDLKPGEKSLVKLMSGANVVINLAGAPINRRWTPAYKREIFTSRVETTQRLVKAMAELDTPPEIFISTSAIGAFDSKGLYSESDPPNARDFLGDLSKQWESAALEAESLGVRTLVFRFALVLGHDGGLMKQLLLPFRLGIGGPVGDGSQHFSWIHIDDLVNAYVFALEHRTMSGIYHLCAPNPVTNLGFTKALGAALHRPTLFRVPELLLKLIYGEGAEVMTSGQQVVSARLPESGFQFRYASMESAVAEIVTHSCGKSTVSGFANPGSKI